MEFNAYVTDILTEDQQEHEAPMRTTITLEMTGGHSERRTLFAIMRAALPVSVSMTSVVSKTSMPQIVQQNAD